MGSVTSKASLGVLRNDSSLALSSTSPGLVGVGVVVVAVCVTSGLVYRLVLYKDSRRTGWKGKGKRSSKMSLMTRPASSKSRKSELDWNTAIFFPSYFPEEPGSVFQKLLKYIQSAEKSLKICVMTITYDPLLKEIIKKHNSGVKVQVFTSYYCAYGDEKRSGKVGEWFKPRGDS